LQIGRIAHDNPERIPPPGWDRIFEDAISPTTKVWTIETIKQTAQRTRGCYDRLIARGSSEYAIDQRPACSRPLRSAEAAPFDEIACGIDHIPRPLVPRCNIAAANPLAAFLQHFATIYARLSLNHRQQPRSLYNCRLC
jgi:hypothetical protein